MFDAVRTAKAAATNYIAEKGWAAYQQAAISAGVTNLRDMDEAQALTLCKALGHGAMFAKAKAEGNTPTPTITNRQKFSDMAAKFYADDNAPGGEPTIDVAEIYARYNNPPKANGNTSKTDA